MKKSWPILLLCVILIILALLFFHKKQPIQSPSPQTQNTTSDQTVEQKSVMAPVTDAQNRVTKKPFGIYITAKTSPVQPEKFAGYHTGTDFETFPSEANAEMPFYAICAGKILTKRTASGYGGVFVQSCTIDNQSVTVIYGHVSLKSILKNIGDSLAQDEQIGFLGQPPTETDGERKHLHLGIHKGTSINIAGYVQSQSALSGWLDWQKLTL
jgi:hypothetical protein